MVTLIANHLDSNYSQTHINNFYTQAKKLIQEPFEFIVFTTDDEMKLLETTKKKEGYIEGIQFHVPKYGKDWIEIDLIQHTKRGEKSFFITPNVILNDPKSIFNYIPSGGIEKLILEDENLCYFIHRNEKVENILNKWNEMEDTITFESHEFEQAFYSNVLEEFSFLKNTNKTYPEKTEEDIVALPYWYIDYTDEQLDLMYNRATDLYPYMPSQVQIELINNTGDYLTLDQIKDSFSGDFINKSKLKRIAFKGLEGEPTDNPEITDICEYLSNHWGIGIDLNTNGKSHDKYWWGTLATLFKTSGNITMNINTSNPDKKILEHASILLELGCRVFWNYSHTSLAQSEDVKKAKIKSKTLGFTGFIYNDEIKEEVKPIEKKKKEEIPDYKLIELGTLKSVKQDAVYVERKIKFSPHVKCEGKIKNQFYLSATGNVFPCKHVALTITTAENSPEHTTEFLYDWSKNNINNFTLEQIFTNDFYKGYFNNLLKLNPEIIHNEQGGTC